MPTPRWPHDDELRDLRAALDELVAKRLRAPLTEADERRYTLLARRESALLAATTTS